MADQWNSNLELQSINFIIVQDLLYEKGQMLLNKGA